MALFNKDGQGSAELHDLTGTFYAANRYENIAVETEAATAEVARTIGTALMKRAEQYYSSEMYSPTGTSLDDILVRMIRLPVACLAMVFSAKYRVARGQRSEAEGRRRRKSAVGMDV